MDGKLVQDEKGKEGRCRVGGRELWWGRGRCADDMAGWPGSEETGQRCSCTITNGACMEIKMTWQMHVRE